MKNWVLAATRPLVLTMVFCGTNVLTSCGNSDNSTTPDTTALTEWQAGKSVSAEAEAGFDWGGDWTNRKDYQHFEIVE